MIKVGLCGWTLGMQQYFQHYPLVEVQQTFYDPPGAKTLLRWRASAPEGFEFTLKAWQLITHQASSATYRRLRRILTDEEKAGAGGFRKSAIVAEGWAATFRCARLLRATAVLFQCPASFRPTDDSVDHMRAFFTQLDRDRLRFLWEPRGDWPQALVRELCEELELVHVVDPFVSQTVTPELVYFRLHGIGGSRHSYSDAELQRVAEWSTAAPDAYVMFNNLPRRGDSERFIRMLERRGASVSRPAVSPQKS